jgi:hypothetical protein
VWLAANGLLWHRMTQGNNLAFSTSSDLVWEFLSDPPWSELPFLVFSYAVYIGLFALPIIVSVSWRDVRRLSGSPLVIAGVTTWFSVFLFVQYSMRGQLFPYIRNVVTNWGLFHPHEFVVGDRPLLWDRGWGTAVGLTGVLSFVLWQTTVAARRLMAGCYHRNADDAVSDDEPLRHRRILVLLLIFQMGYVFATSPILYDRHLLLLAPTVIILGAASVRRARLVAPAVVLIGYGAYAVCGTHDVHLISRAVFCEGTRLLESGVAADRIDAGYAFDGWHMYETSQQIQPAVPMRLPPWWPTDRAVRTTELRQPWWIYNLVTQVHPEYIVSISADVPSHMFDSGGHLQVVGKLQAGFTWAPWRRLVIVVFRRSSQ